MRGLRDVLHAHLREREKIADEVMRKRIKQTLNYPRQTIPKRFLTGVQAENPNKYGKNYEESRKPQKGTPVGNKPCGCEYSVGGFAFGEKNKHKKKLMLGTWNAIPTGRRLTKTERNPLLGTALQ